MEQELAHSFNLILNEEVSGQIKNIQKKLADRFSELRFYDNSPHLAIGTKFMGQSLTNVFVNALENEFNKDMQWEIEFAGFGRAETGNYIFLNLTEESRAKLFDLHERTFLATKEIGFEGHNGEAPRYPYDPHISIIKIKAEEIEEALKLLNDDFKGTKMVVKSYEITREELDERGFGNFPRIKEIKLKEGLVTEEIYTKVEDFVRDTFTKNGVLTSRGIHSFNVAKHAKELRPNADVAILISALAHDIEGGVTAFEPS
jgi:2'-5' RNA ligase